jgi:16S rRNA (cytosine967-C5)-methyltransferase
VKKPTNSRLIAHRILSEFDKHPGNLDRIIDNGLRGKFIDHRDRRFIFEIVYGVMRHKATLDYVADHYLADKTEKTEDALYRILRIGLYQLIYMSKVPDHAAVNETVLLAKADGDTARFTTVINAVMRNLINNKKIIPLPDPQKDLVGRLAIEFSHPKWMIERWMSKYGLSKTKQILSFNNEKPPVFLRRKIRDISRQQFDADVKTICEPATGYLNLYNKLKHSLIPENIQMIKQGLCNIQAPSSGWVVALLDVKKGEHLLDLCAAPGGKTALMSELTGDTGTVCACDSKWQRLMSVVETCHRMNLNNVYPLLCDCTSPPFTGHFDKILLDVPCSSSGVLNRHPEARWVKRVEDIALLVETQKKILNAAASLIGVGGIIVYSTCSIEPEENEKQIESFLKDNPSFKLDSCPEAIPDNFVNDYGYLQITPFEHTMDGMFGARLIRVI